MTRVFKVTDGTDTVDFQDASSGYTLLAHTPAVAGRQPNNPELYSREVETLEISVSGTSRAQLAARVQLLAELIDRAERLARGDKTVDPVLFQDKVEGSSLSNPLQALITGPPPGQRSVMLPARFDGYTADKVGSQGDPLVWRFQRRGALLEDAEQQSVAASTANNPGLMSVTFTGGSVDIPAPVKVAIDVGTMATGSFVTPIALLYGRGADRLLLLEGEAGTSSSGWSTVADSDASGGNVIQLAPSGANQAISWTGLSIASSARKFGLVLNCRNLSTTISYKLKWRPRLTGPYSGWVSIGTDTQYPQLVIMPIMTNAKQTSGISLVANASATGTGSTDGLEIDTLGLVALDDNASGIIWVNDVGGQSGAGVQTPVVNHRLLSEISPIVEKQESAFVVPYAYAGNPYFYNLGDTLNVLILGNKGAFWRMREDDGSPGTLLELGLTADRRKAYLVPE